MIWVFVAINLAGARSGGGVQIVTTVLKLLPMFAIMLLAAWLLLTDPHEFTRQPPSTPLTFKDLLAASTVALFAMLGIESATIPAGRVRDPERTIPRATLAGTIVTAAIYVAVSATAILLLPQAQLAKSSAPFVDLLDRFLGHNNGRWLAAFVVVSGLGALNGWTLLVGELTRSMAAQGVLPRPFTRLNSRGAPTLALVVTAVLASALVLMNYSKSLVQGFTFLTLVVTAANLPLYLFCAFALVRRWLVSRNGPDIGSAGGRDVLVLGALGTVYSTFAIAGLGSEPFLWSLALGAIGLPVWWFMRRREAAV
jgi:APA family basic amino acid/polyamine antiporter